MIFFPLQRFLSMQIQKLLRASGQIMKLAVSAYKFYGGIIIIKQSDV